MCISTEIASIFPVPILHTPIQKINDIYCYNPMFHTKNHLVIIIYIYIFYRKKLLNKNSTKKEQTKLI